MPTWEIRSPMGLVKCGLNSNIFLSLNFRDCQKICCTSECWSLCGGPNCVSVTSDVCCVVLDVDTAPGTTLSSPPGWYASSSDTDSDADVKHDIPVRQTVTQVSETRDSCAVPASLPLKTDFDLIERQSASEYVQHLLIFLPSLLDCVSQSDVDHMMQKFSSDVCAGECY